MMPYTITSTVIFGAIIVGLSGGGGGVLGGREGTISNSKFYGVNNYGSQSLLEGGLGVLPPRKFRNMKC